MKKIINKIIDDLVVLGITKGDNLLVHSSLHSLGEFEDKAKIVIEALLSVLGKDGTLIMPTLSYENVTLNYPYFDVKKTPSCVGGLTEYFRQRKDILRSVHPTHSFAAVGADASDYLQDHYLDNTPAGKNSPLVKLKKANGKILFIGCKLRPNTSMHAVEELVEPPYLFGKESVYFITDNEGKQYRKKYRNHNFIGYRQRYDRIEKIIDKKYLSRGKILSADSFLLDSAKMWEVALKKLSEEPFYFVDVIKDYVQAK